MKNNISFFAKIVAKSFMKWLTIVLIGLILSIVCIMVSGYLLGNNEGGGYAGAGSSLIGAIVGIFLLFIEEFWTVFLLFSSFVFFALYFVIANKIALQSALSLVWKNKAVDFISPKVTSYVQGISSNQPEWLNQVMNKTTLKSTLINANKNDNTSPKMQRRILNYGLKKISLDDVDFQNKNINLPEVITQKIIQKISEISKPSWKPFYILLGIQFVLLIFALYFDHT